MAKLSESRIRAAIRTTIASGRPKKVFDMHGLYLLLEPRGEQCRSGWRQRYRQAGKEKLLSLGPYPDITLATARERSADIRKQITNGLDPSATRKTERAEKSLSSLTFEHVAREWHAKFRSQWSEDHAELILDRLVQNIFPWLGSKHIAEITSTDVLTAIERVALRGAGSVARRVLQSVKKIFAWAIAKGWLIASPAAHIAARDHLPRVKKKHRASIKDPARLATLLRSIDVYHGGLVVRCALKFLALTFVRPSELRYAQWQQFELDGPEALWRIPAEQMKMKGEHHLVPLSKQAIDVLREIQPLTGGGGKGLVFPGPRDVSRPLSENTLNAAIRVMGFSQQEHCAHGFRGTASTMLNEMQWNPDAIELQLAHMERDETRESYNAATHLLLRRKMMQAWADYLDDLRAGSSSTLIGMHSSTSA